MRTKILASALLMSILFPMGASVAQASIARTQVHPVVQLSGRAAVCAQWKVAGTWTSGQSNTAQITFAIRQAGTRLSGTSSVSSAEAVRLGFRTGRLTGTIKGDNFVVITHWTKSTVDGISHIGKYYGAVSKGHVEGHGVDLAVPGGVPVIWRAKGPAVCVKV